MPIEWLLIKKDNSFFKSIEFRSNCLLRRWWFVHATCPNSDRRALLECFGNLKLNLSLPKKSTLKTHSAVCQKLFKFVNFSSTSYNETHYFWWTLNRLRNCMHYVSFCVLSGKVTVLSGATKMALLIVIAENTNYHVQNSGFFQPSKAANGSEEPDFNIQIYRSFPTLLHWASVLCSIDI